MTVLYCSNIIIIPQVVKVGHPVPVPFMTSESNEDLERWCRKVYRNRSGASLTASLRQTTKGYIIVVRCR